MEFIIQNKIIKLTEYDVMASLIYREYYNVLEKTLDNYQFTIDYAVNTIKEDVLVDLIKIARNYRNIVNNPPGRNIEEKRNYKEYVQAQMEDMCISVAENDLKPYCDMLQKICSGESLVEAIENSFEKKNYGTYGQVIVSQIRQFKQTREYIEFVNKEKGIANIQKYYKFSQRNSDNETSLYIADIYEWRLNMQRSKGEINLCNELIITCKKQLLHLITELAKCCRWNITSYYFDWNTYIVFDNVEEEIYKEYVDNGFLPDDMKNINREKILNNLARCPYRRNQYEKVLRFIGDCGGEVTRLANALFIDLEEYKKEIMDDFLCIISKIDMQDEEKAAEIYNKIGEKKDFIGYDKEIDVENSKQEVIGKYLRTIGKDRFKTDDSIKMVCEDVLNKCRKIGFKGEIEWKIATDYYYELVKTVVMSIIATFVFVCTCDDNLIIGIIAYIIVYGLFYRKFEKAKNIAKKMENYEKKILLKTSEDGIENEVCKPIYKKWWFWGIILFLFAIYGSL